MEAGTTSRETIMGVVKPILLTAILMSVFLCTNALAQQDQPAAPAAKAEKPAKPPPPDPKKLHKRRAVVQQTYGMPAPAAPVDIYRPALNPPPSLGLPPAGPVILQGCASGVCSDPSGARLNGGVGTTLLDSKGRTCVQGPVAAQCF
jgi:hypothetical protein